jgi:hypothetical protein
MWQKRVTDRSASRDAPVVLVTVGYYWTSIDAWLIRNRLAAAGIDAFVVDEFMATTYWIYANAIRGIKVQVPQEQVSQALDVLDTDDSNIFKLVPVAPRDENQPLCRHCGSPELYHERFEGLLVFLLLFLFGIPLPVPSSAVECYDCGVRDGPPTTYKLQFGLRHLLLLMFIVAVVLGIMRLKGHTWFESAATPSRDWMR